MISHSNCLQYLERIEEIISNPDYIGKHPTIDNSIELIKRFDENIMIAIKLDLDKNYLYVASLFDVSEYKIANRLHSGRLKIFTP